MTHDIILRIIKTLLFANAGSCLYIGVNSMKEAFRCKKNAQTEQERLHGWKILINVSAIFFMVAFLLIVLGYYVYTRIAETG